MPFCTTCGAELAPNAKFCGSCGTVVEQDAPAQPAPQPVAPQQPQYQQPVAPQPAPQPVAPQPAPQPVAPQQPKVQPAAPQQAQHQQASKMKIDYLPNVEHEKTKMFTWAGILGALISVALLFISKTSDYRPSYVWYALTIVAQGFTCIAMVNIFFSLRKGLNGYPATMPLLLRTTAILNIVTASMIILTAILVLIGGSGIHKTIKTLGDIYPVALMLLHLCLIVVAVKLLDAYEGNMKPMAIALLVIPCITLVMERLAMTARGSSVETMATLSTIGMQGASCYAFYMSYQIFTGKKLF